MRYISENLVYSRLCLACDHRGKDCKSDCFAYKDLMSGSSVEIVRCGNCKRCRMTNESYPLYHCNRHNSLVGHDEFCSYGEEKYHEQLEALRILEDGILCGESDTAENNEALDVAIKALRRQAPQKPIVEMPEYEDGYELYPGGVYCPSCERWLRTDDKLTFCQDCGQAIDWSEWRENE